MSICTITAGDAVEIPVQLKKDGQTFIILSSAVVKAAIVSDSAALTGTVALSSLDPGAEWSTGLVVCKFEVEDTADLPVGTGYRIEIRVDDTTWHAGSLNVRRGFIT